MFSYYRFIFLYKMQTLVSNSVLFCLFFNANLRKDLEKVSELNNIFPHLN